MSITIFDLETTGLVGAKGRDLIHQPYITEFYGMQVDNNFKFVKDFYTYVKPPIPIPHFITKLTGIDDNAVKDAPSFIEVFKKITNVFWRSHTTVAHNLSFDLEVMITELKRIGKEHHFPYPPIHFCTVEQSMHIKGYRLKNGELYTLATGKEIVDAHKSKNDTMATFESYKWLIRRQK